MNNKDKFEINNFIGQAIRKKRLAMGTLQKQLADMVQVPRSTLSQIEGGHCPAEPHVLYKLAIIFNCEIAEFYPPLGQFKPRIRIATIQFRKGARKVYDRRTQEKIVQDKAEGLNLDKRVYRRRQKPEEIITDRLYQARYKNIVSTSNPLLQ